MANDHTYPFLTVPSYDEEELFHNPNEQVNNLQAYYMSQFNLELENAGKIKPNKIDAHLEVNSVENYDLETLSSWDIVETPNNVRECDFEIIDEVIENNNISEESIKDVLFDLDSIEFDDKNDCDNSNQTDASVKIDFEHSLLEPNCDYIDDESLIDELCREDSEPYRLTPDIFNDSYLSSITNDKNFLPSIETFSKRYYNYDNDQIVAQNEINDEANVIVNNNEVAINNLDAYSYPNNILYNINNDNKNYILPDTPTSCSEFTYERSERKISVSESIESDVQSSIYYDENSEGFDDDELFINLDNFGIDFDRDNDNGNVEEEKTKNYNEKKIDKVQGDKVCLWENCYKKYPNQHTLVEHIERAHVNTYKGDEFSCLWRECARARRPFNARYKLLIHMRVHSGHKPNRCHHPGCGKAFSRLENLKIHVRSHTGERPYACPAPHCRKAFSNSSDRAKHQRTHFNARPYACGAVGCGKSYTDPSSLRKHVKSHPHFGNVPRTCMPPARTIRRPQQSEQTVPTSPAKLTTLRCIRDKLTIVPRLQVL